MKYFISFLLLLLVYSCSTEPIETGPYNSYYCELNGETYSNSYYHYLYCNPEGVILWDSLVKWNDFVLSYAHGFSCSDSLNQSFHLSYNTYLRNVQIMIKTDSALVRLDRDSAYTSDGEKRMAPFRCLLDNLRTKERFADTIPETFFSTDPIEIFESVTTCEEQIANLWPFYELCKDLIENAQQ